MSVLAVSVGDPAGVGPEVSAEAAAEHRSLARLVLFGDGERLERVLRGRGCPVDRVPPDGELSGPEGSVGVAHTSTWSSGVVDARRPTLEGGKAQIAMLRGVSRAVLEGRAQAVVTGPVSKEAISLSGQRFEGHTEWFAEAAGLDHDAVTMMFLGPPPLRRACDHASLNPGCAGLRYFGSSGAHGTPSCRGPDRMAWEVATGGRGLWA